MVEEDDASLPVDPDVEGDDRRPVHLRPGAIALVATGGAVGTALRGAVTHLGARAWATPYVTFAINLVGALLLGVLLEQLARRGSDVGGRRRIRLLLGTGALGGVTTYSSLAVDVATLGGRGQFAAAAFVALGTLLLGAILTGIGLLVGSLLSSRRAGDPA